MVNAYPPLGLGYVASSVKAAGHEVSIHDFGLEPRAAIETIVETVARETPDVVGITTWSHLYHVCADLAGAFRKRLPEARIVLGGPHVTIFPAETLEECPAVDFVVFGEGEIATVELLEALGGRRSPATIPGLAWRDGGRIVRNPNRDLNRELDELPFPDRHLMDIGRYPLRASTGEPMTTMMTSRGCPYACTYCFKGLFGRRYTKTDNEVVIEEIGEVIRDFGIRHFYFVDDLFIVDLNRLADFVRRLREARLDIRWQALARVDRLRKEHYEAMAEVGCVRIHYGIETGDPGIMLRVDKEATIEDVRNSVRWAHESGIMTKGYFMIGLPGDTEETVRRTIDLACELPLAEAMFSLTTPFPGTKLWEEIAHRFEGIPRRELFRRASYYYGTHGVAEPLFNLSELPSERLIELMDEAEYAFRTRGFAARQLQDRLGSRFHRFLYRLSQRRWVKRLGRGPFRDLGKRWLRRRLRGRPVESGP